MNTKDVIISNTIDILWNRGYYGTGINEVIKKSKVPKGSLYHHFPGGKDELISIALNSKAQELAEIFKEAMKGMGTAENGLKAVVDVYIDKTKGKTPSYGCHLATVTLDVALDNEKMRKHCEKLFDYWIQSIESYLNYKNVENAFQKAEAFMAMLEGALLLSKVKKSDKPLHSIKKNINQLL